MTTANWNDLHRSYIATNRHILYMRCYLMNTSYIFMISVCIHTWLCSKLSSSLVVCSDITRWTWHRHWLWPGQAKKFWWWKIIIISIGYGMCWAQAHILEELTCIHKSLPNHMVCWWLIIIIIRNLNHRTDSIFLTYLVLSIHAPYLTHQIQKWPHLRCACVSISFLCLKFSTRSALHVTLN